MEPQPTRLCRALVLENFPEVKWTRLLKEDVAERPKKETDNSNIKRNLLRELTDRSKVLGGSKMVAL